MAYVLQVMDAVTGQYASLDVEGVDFPTIFSISSIQDISNRTGEQSKTIKLKATKTNRSALGNPEHLNRKTNMSNLSRLGPNANSLRDIECRILEEGITILAGSIKILSIDLDFDKNNAVYEALITGKVIDILAHIKEKFLTDLDYTHLRHQYSLNAIQSSWSAPKGSGYVYPYMDYGFKTTANVALQNPEHVPLKNLRPAIYAKEYMDRIIYSVPGYSYEVKSYDPTFIDKFKSLVIPDNQGDFRINVIGKYLKLWNNNVSRNYNTQNNTNPNHVNGMAGAFQWLECSIPLPAQSAITPPGSTGLDQPAFITQENANYNGLPATVYTLTRAIKSNARVKVDLSNIHNHDNQDLDFTVQLIARPYINPSSGDFNSLNYNLSHRDQAANTPTWNVDKFRLASGGHINNKTIDFEIGERDYEAGTQFILKIWVEVPGAGPFHNGVKMNMDVNSVFVNIAKDEFSSFSAEYNLDTSGSGLYDMMSPSIPVNVKQLDFVKNIMSMFNLYVYPDKHNEKHLIFQPYDDYYAFTQPDTLKQYAIDWTHKVDRKSGGKERPNGIIPKSYVFTYKEDGDFLNDNYKKLFNEVYGTRQAPDSLGSAPTKKVELMFSPTLMVQPKGNSKMFPVITKDGVEYAVKGPVKSNIRILFYNGLKSVNEPWNIVKEYFNQASNQAVDQVVNSAPYTTYPQVSTFYVPGGSNNLTPTDSLLFDRPRLTWFTATQPFLDATTLYDGYYRGVTTHLTEPDMVVLEAKVHLTEVDINFLRENSLRIPVFIDLSEFGHAYFRILKVEYNGRFKFSRVELQKIEL